MKKLNGKNRVVTLLRKAAYSRVELARATGLGKSALTKVTKALFDEGIIEEAQVAVKQSSEQGRGRPETLLQLVPNIKFSLCFYLTKQGVSSYLIDFTGKIHAVNEVDWPVDPANHEIHVAYSTDVLLDIVKQGANVLCAQQSLTLDQLELISIATFGKVSQQDGIVVHSQFFQDTNVKLAEIIGDCLGVTTKIFNVNYCCAFQLQQMYPEKESFISLCLGLGLGLGLCLDGQLVTGRLGSTLGIGHVNYEPNGKKCYCGAKGCTEAYVTSDAIIDEIESLRGLSISGNDVSDKMQSIKQLLASGDVAAHRSIEKVSQAVGDILAQLMVTFDISTIFMSGDTAVLFHYLEQYIRQYLTSDKRYQTLLTKPQIIRVTDVKASVGGLIQLTNSQIMI